MADVQIVVVDGPNTGREFELSGSTVVGRDQSAGLVIDDSEASRRHASLSLSGSTVTVEDLGSTNGTFVNGARISAPRDLVGGDKVRIGTTVFEVRAEAGEPEPAQATRVGTELPGLDDLRVTAPRQVPDFAKEPEAEAPQPPAAPEPPAPEPVVPEEFQPTAARDIPQPLAPTNAPPPSGPPGGAGGPPGGGPIGGPPPPPTGGPPPPPTGGPPPSAPPPSAPPPPPAGFGAQTPYAGGQQPPFPPSSPPGGLLAPSAYSAPPGSQLSGWWRRVGATLLDGLISLPFLVIFYVLIVSPILMKREGPNNGQTWGKQALGIRVVQDSGQPFTYGTALLRDFVIKSLLFGIIAILSLLDSLWPLWDEQNQALHDKLAGTHVLRK